MKKYSILYPSCEGVRYNKLSENTCHDLALDLLCKKVTDNPKEYRMIMDILSEMTSDKRVAKYRQKVFSDILKFPDLRRKITELFDKFEFINNFGVLRWDENEKNGIWHLLKRLDELNDYISCIEEMKKCLEENPIESEGLRGFKKYIEELYNAAGFEELKKDISELKIHSSEVKSVTIGINLNERFEATGLGLISVNNKHFKKSGIVSNFSDAVSSKNKIQSGNDWNGNMHYYPVEAGADLAEAFGGILNRFGNLNLAGKIGVLSGGSATETVAKIANADGVAHSTFYLSDVANKMLGTLIKKLRETLNKYADIAVLNISGIIPEFVYYIRFAEFIDNMLSEGYSFCEANVIDCEDENLETQDFYNIRLALSGMKKEQITVNNFGFDKDHTVYIFTGANRGGKTTVTQGIGIMYVLAQGGIFVPASSFLYKPVDCIYTHFPADEDKTYDLGRLGEECIRFKESFDKCTKDSLFLLNESFSTTSFEEGYYIAYDSVKALLKKSVKTIYNTHMHKLGENTDELNREFSNVKASSLVVRSEQGNSSFKIEIAPPSGMSYARNIAEKYGVTFEMLTDGIEEK